MEFHHAAQHLTTRLAAPKVGQLELEQWRRGLRDEPGPAPAALVELATRRAALPVPPGGPGAEDVDNEVTHFNNNQERMDHAGTTASNLPIGSGMQEGACKTLVVERMKQAGVSWRDAGGQAVPTFRRLLQSRRHAEAWKALAGTLHTDVIVLNEARRQNPRAPAAA